MRRRIGLIAVLVLFASGVAFGVWRVSRRFREPQYTYDPVIASTAIDGWKPPWTVASADGSKAVAPRKWLVIGWDGASWDLVLPLLETGKMPNLEALMRDGAYGDLYSFQPTWSPVLWTTVATGVDPERHGILAWGMLEKSGEVRRLFNNSDRKVRALWNLLSEREKTSLVIGWHNTFPTDRVKGLMVSNFLYQEHLAGTMGAQGDPRGSRSGLVYPNEFLKEVLAIQREVATSLPTEIRRFVSFQPNEASEFMAPLPPALRPDQDRRQFFLKKAYLFDAFNGRVAEDTFQKIQPDVAMVHFQCLDLIGHYFLYFHDPQRFDSMSWSTEQRAKLDGQRRHYRGTVAAFYAWADEWLGRLLALRDPDYGVILLSDHGFAPEPDPERSGHHPGAPPGVFVVAGPGVRPGYRAEGATLYDIFPTIAASMGLPVAQDLRGKVMKSWFSPEAASGIRVDSVPTYETGGRYVPDVPPPSSVDDNLIEQLKALGYIE